MAIPQSLDETYGDCCVASHLAVMMDGFFTAPFFVQVKPPRGSEAVLQRSSMKKTNNAKTCLGVLENEESEDADENADQRAADNVTDEVHAGYHSDDGDHRGDSQHDDADGRLDIQKSHRDDIGADSVP